jgi:hypothetical protein
VTSHPEFVQRRKHIDRKLFLLDSPFLRLGCREQRNEGHPIYKAMMCKEGTTLAKYDQNAMTRLGAPRSPFFGRHGSCVHGPRVHGARDRTSPVHGRWQTPKRARPNRPAQKKKRKRRTHRSPNLARRATGASASEHMQTEGLGVEYPADHSSCADDPVRFYPEGSSLLFLCKLVLRSRSLKRVSGQMGGGGRQPRKPCGASHMAPPSEGPRPRAKNGQRAGVRCTALI